MNSTLRVLAFTCAIIPMAAVVVVPRQTAPRKLGAPTATLDQEFTGIDGVRELRDGRVVVLDARDRAIHVIDLKTNYPLSLTA